MYEEDALQQRLAKFYASLPDRYPEHSIRVIDGSRDIDAIHQECLAAAVKLLEGENACVH